MMEKPVALNRPWSFSALVGSGKIVHGRTAERLPGVNRLLGDAVLTEANRFACDEVAWLRTAFVFNVSFSSHNT